MQEDHKSLVFDCESPKNPKCLEVNRTVIATPEVKRMTHCNKQGWLAQGPVIQEGRLAQGPVTQVGGLAQGPVILKEGRLIQELLHGLQGQRQGARPHHFAGGHYAGDRTEWLKESKFNQA